MTTRTVYIVDDNREFRESTQFWLSSVGFDVQAWGNPQQAIDALAQRDPRVSACLMLDVRMPELSGLDVHDKLIECGMQLPVIYMSGHADVPIAVQAMQKGAVTLLEKPFDDEALESALQCAFAAGAAAPAPADTLPDEAHGSFLTRESRLTPRERQVLDHVIQGTYNKVIADRIGLSIKTVELYRARGMAKMQARSVAELTRMMVTRRV